MRRKHVAMVKIYAVCLSALLGFSVVPEAIAFNEPDILTRQIKATAIKGETIDQVINLLASEYDIPVGIELGDEKRTPYQKINLDLPGTNLKDFLDSVIATDPRYTWKLEGGVIHVWPVKERDPLLANLLDEKISHFSIIGEASRYRVYNDIVDLPEIRSKLVIAGVEPMIFLASGSMRKLPKETLFTETNLTLRELLDRIILKTEIRQWVISRWGKNSEYISLKGG
jgi:hypothetical protein